MSTLIVGENSDKIEDITFISSFWMSAPLPAILIFFKNKPKD